MLEIKCIKLSCSYYFEHCERKFLSERKFINFVRNIKSKPLTEA